MYNKFFGFKEKPFKLVPNPEYLFLSKSHEEALAHLSYAISQGDGFVEITGEVGTGKTTLCRVFLENLDKSINAAYIFNPKLDALQLLKAINDEFGIDSTPDNTKDLIDRLNAFLIAKKSAGQKVLVLIDEAQNLSLEVLEQLRLLSNLETTQEKLLQIILVGQPELGEMLSSHQLRQLGQRITINCQISPLTYEETKDYIRHRIALASHRAGPPFDKASYHAIYQYSQGVPRLINIACDRTLLNAFSRNSFKITGAITKEAVSELTRKKQSNPYSWLQGPAAPLVISAVCIPLIILLLYLGKGEIPQSSAISEPSSSEQVAREESGQALPEPGQVHGTSAAEDQNELPQAEETEAIEAAGPGPDLAANSFDRAASPAISEPLANAAAADITFPEPPAPFENNHLENDPDAQDFGDYLKNLNTRFSRNSSTEEVLKLWLPSAEITIAKDRIETDRSFFQEAARQFDLQVQPVATEADLAFMQTLNLPAVFTFYLAGHSWPKYLAVAYIDQEKIYFIAGGEGRVVSVDRDIFLQYWSGEAYVFWKNFNGLDGVVSQRSRGRDVITLKKLLQQLGYADVMLTDIYDNDTQQIIEAVQAKYNLYIDGMVGPFTKIALYNESREFTKPSLVKSEAAGRENGT